MTFCRIMSESESTNRTARERLLLLVVLHFGGVVCPSEMWAGILDALRCGDPEEIWKVYPPGVEDMLKRVPSLEQHRKTNPNGVEFVLEKLSSN